MHGMISQVEGMAKALNAEYTHKIVKLSFPWNFIPPKLSPISEIVLKDKIYLTENKIPDLIISCGRKSVIPSIALKRKNPGIFTIHIQNPKVNSKNFDAVVAPRHDSDYYGPNVYHSEGAIHYITHEEIQAAKNYLSLYQVYPDSKKAADALLKLGISLVNMDQKEQGCVTFIQLKDTYPNANTAVLDRGKLEIEKNYFQLLLEKLESNGLIKIN